MNTPSHILFFGDKNLYGEFSNFYQCNFLDKQGLRYCCTEQYFMKKKQETFDPTNVEIGTYIMNTSDPKKIKGRRKSFRR